MYPSQILLPFALLSLSPAKFWPPQSPQLPLWGACCSWGIFQHPVPSGGMPQDGIRQSENQQSWLAETFPVAASAGGAGQGRAGKSMEQAVWSWSNRAALPGYRGPGDEQGVQCFPSMACQAPRLPSLLLLL